MTELSYCTSAEQYLAVFTADLVLHRLMKIILCTLECQIDTRGGGSKQADGVGLYEKSLIRGVCLIRGGGGGGYKLMMFTALILYGVVYKSSFASAMPMSAVQFVSF